VTKPGSKVEHAGSGQLDPFRLEPIKGCLGDTTREGAINGLCKRLVMRPTEAANGRSARSTIVATSLSLADGSRPSVPPK
jgi:hypothetical protein